MKILSDFDGVITDLASEAAHVRSVFLKKLKEVSTLPQNGSNDPLQAFLDYSEDLIRKNPFSHGWRSQKRISAYAFEDHFIYNNALGECLDQLKNQSHPHASHLASDLMKAGFDSFSALSYFAFQAMAKESFEGNLQAIDAQTAETISKLLNAGHEVVVVSNSGTERILKMISGAGLNPVAHAENPKAQFRIRGGANKFVLGEIPKSVRVNDLDFDVARPQYQTILTEEKPDAVVGDVFSLDLSLPMHLGVKNLFLRERPYTPEWAKKISGIRLLKNFSDLPGLLN